MQSLSVCFDLGPGSSLYFARHAVAHISIVSLLFQLPARCVCNNVAKILIPPLGSFVSLNPFGSEKKLVNVSIYFYIQEKPTEIFFLFSFTCKQFKLTKESILLKLINNSSSLNKRSHDREGGLDTRS